MSTCERTEDVETIEEEKPVEAVLSEAEKLHYEQIRQVNLAVNDALREHDIAKAKAKAAKDHLESLQYELTALISEGPKLPDSQMTLPFDDWRAVPIENAITITDKQLEKLHEAGINTVIEFETERGGNRFANVKGIGEKTVDKWEEEILEWMSQNAREQEGEGDVHQ